MNQSADRTLSHSPLFCFCRSLAIIRRELALRDLKHERFTDAFRKFSKAYLGFHQV